MTSITIPFESLFDIALGKKANVSFVNDEDIPEVIRYLQKKITGQILNNVNIGVDPHNPGTISHRRSLNYTAKLWKLEGGCQARLDMRNNYDTEAGSAAKGNFVCKLTHYQGPSDRTSTMTTELPWFNTEGIDTFRDYVVTLGHFSLHKYTMTSNRQGCRFHA